jgi:hypothetical protein
MSHPELERAAGPVAPVIDAVTRLGFAAKGLVTVLVGVLALRYALREGGGITDQEGAIEWVLRHPFGRWMLGALAVGLAGYAVWMFVAAVLDPERKGQGFQAVAERLGFFITGIGYTLLGYTAFALLLGRSDVGGEDVRQLIAGPWYRWRSRTTRRGSMGGRMRCGCSRGWAGGWCWPRRRSA